MLNCKNLRVESFFNINLQIYNNIKNIDLVFIHKIRLFKSCVYENVFFEKFRNFLKPPKVLTVTFYPNFKNILFNSLIILFCSFNGGNGNKHSLI